jgi:ribosomal-protein-alanine N-acetyltransferase
MMIREMIETDLEQVYSIEKETFLEPWSKEDFLNAFQNENNGYLVAEDQEGIIGYCGYWGIAGEGYIYNVAVKKENRKNQIGYQLLKELIDHGLRKGIKDFTLEVRYTNEAAIRLYKRIGFEAAGIRKDFYSKPKEDAVIMWMKPLQ